ncbi:MAG: DUF1217 domain-containing protein [Rhodospirillales bacterium]|nr:DUF1217 domain-containing protein [Rhodospirillales bacterium]
MSGTAGTSLIALFGSSATTASLLDTLYGRSGQAMTSIAPSVALRNAERNGTRQVAITAKQPDVKLAVDAFRRGVAKATSVETLLSDPAVMKVLLRANGLGDQAGYTALAKRALLSDLNDPKSLANTLSDTRWKAVAKTYDFANKGLSVIKDAKVQQAIADGYAEITWRETLDRQTPGLSNALTFRAQAAKVESVYDILGDKVLRDVVTKALGVPAQIAFQPLEAQAKAITSRLDLAKLKDAKFVENVAHRYLLAAADAAAATRTSTGFVDLAVQARGLIV